MKHTYVVVVLWPYYDSMSVLCTCKNEADAQEMVLSIEQGIAYDTYIHYLQYDINARPQQFFHPLVSYRTAFYDTVMAF